MRYGHVAVKALDDCHTVYVLLPPYFAMSDVRRLLALIRAAVPPGRNIILVGNDISAAVVRWLGELLPEAPIHELRRARVRNGPISIPGATMQQRGSCDRRPTPLSSILPFPDPRSHSAPSASGQIRYSHLDLGHLAE